MKIGRPQYTPPGLPRTTARNLAMRLQGMRWEFRTQLLEDETHMEHGDGKSAFDQALRLEVAKGAPGLPATL
jgi:hypothetical protein